MSHSSNLRRLYRRFDSNKDGFLGPSELRGLLGALGVEVPDARGDAGNRALMAEFSASGSLSRVSEEDVVRTLRRRGRSQLERALGAGRGGEAAAAPMLPATLVTYGIRAEQYHLFSGTEEQVVRHALRACGEEASMADPEDLAERNREEDRDDGGGDDAAAAEEEEEKQHVHWLHFQSLSGASASLLEDHFSLSAGSLARSSSLQPPYTSVDQDGRLFWAVLHVTGVDDAPMRIERTLGAAASAAPSSPYRALPGGAAPLADDTRVVLENERAGRAAQARVHQLSVVAIDNHTVITVSLSSASGGRQRGGGRAARRSYGLRLFMPLKGILPHFGRGSGSGGRKAAPPSRAGVEPSGPSASTSRVSAALASLPRFEDPQVSQLLTSLHRELGTFPSELRVRGGRFLWARIVADAVEASWDARDTLRDWVGAVEESVRFDTGSANANLHLFSLRSLAPVVRSRLPPDDLLAALAAGSGEDLNATGTVWHPLLQPEALLLSGAQSSIERLHTDVQLVESRTEQLQELLRTRTDQRMTKVLFALTVVTAVFAPFSLLTGWCGMNWSSQNELRAEHGYQVFIGISLFLLAAMVCGAKAARLDRLYRSL